MPGFDLLDPLDDPADPLLALISVAALDDGVGDLLAHPGQQFPILVRIGTPPDVDYRVLGQNLPGFRRFPVAIGRLRPGRGHVALEDLAELSAHHDDTGVGGSLVLDGGTRHAVPDAALGLEVARLALRRFVGGTPSLAVHVRQVPAVPGVIGADGAVRAVGPPTEQYRPPVVDRDVLTKVDRRVVVGRLRQFDGRRHVALEGHVAVVHARPDPVVVETAYGHVDHAVAGARDLPLDVGMKADRRVLKVLAIGAVQEHGVERIHGIFLRVQPVALVRKGEGDEPDARHLEEIEVWLVRDQVGRAHVGPDHAVDLGRRIGTVKETVLQSRIGRFARCFQDGAVDVEQPAVIAAADAPLGDDAVLQRGAPMAAVPVHDAGPPRLVPEGDEVLAERLHRLGQVGEMIRQADGQPEASEVLAHRRPGPGLRQQGVGLRDLP